MAPGVGSTPIVRLSRCRPPGCSVRSNFSQYSTSCYRFRVTNLSSLVFNGPPPRANQPKIILHAMIAQVIGASQLNPTARLLPLSLARTIQAESQPLQLNKKRGNACRRFLITKGRLTSMHNAWEDGLNPTLKNRIVSLCPRWAPAIIPLWSRTTIESEGSGQDRKSPQAPEANPVKTINPVIV